MAEPAYNGRRLLSAAAARHGVRFEVLIAETALWAHPKVHEALVQRTGSAAWFPAVRRGRFQNGEKRGQTHDGVRFDDNSAANLALKTALGIPAKDLVNFETCHLWPTTCYDQRYHTAIANLALLPRGLAGFSDHDPDVQAVLQYRAFELYDWHPDNVDPPTKPSCYPDQWRDPEPFGPRVAASLAKRAKAPQAGYTALSQVPLESRGATGPEMVQVVARPLRPDASGTLSLAPRQLELMKPLWEAFPDSVQGSQLAIRLGNPGNTRLVSSMVKEIKQRGYPIQQDGRGRYWCEPPAGWTKKGKS